MLRTLVLVAAFALAAGAADAQKIDAKGKCHDAKGKMAPMSVCKPAAPAATAKKPPVCKKGKLCGDTCISVKDTCHKK